jgi:hypothetical protein
MGAFQATHKKLYRSEKYKKCKVGRRLTDMKRGAGDRSPFLANLPAAKADWGLEGVLLGSQSMKNSVRVGGISARCLLM